MVEVEEGEHDVEVDVAGQVLRELVRDEPRDFLALDLRLVVDALNADERLPETAALDDVEVPLVAETAADLGFGGLDARGGGQKGEQMDHRQSIVQIGQGGLAMRFGSVGEYAERGITLLDQVIQIHLRLVLPFAENLRLLSTAVRTRKLAGTTSPKNIPSLGTLSSCGSNR